MVDKKISVIIPVYRVEKHIRTCVDSVINQTYNNLEIILVDDGSPDNCPAICDEYAARDSRIQVIHKENGGVSSARNVALAVATGDYIGFTDGDDYIESTMFEKLAAAITEKDGDAAICAYKIIKGTDETSIPISWHTDVLSGSEYVGSILQTASCRPRADIRPYLWNKLFKRSLFDNITFDTSLTIGEDLLVLMEVAPKIDKCVLIDEPLYCYRANEAGVIGTTDYLTQSALGCKMQERIYRLFSGNHTLSDYALENVVVSYFIYFNFLAAFRKKNDYAKVRNTFIENDWNAVKERFSAYSSKFRLGLKLLVYTPELFWLINVIRNRNVKDNI